MLENNFINRLIYANTFLWICVTFTIATIFDMVLTVGITGDFYGTNYLHLATRLAICVFVSCSLLVFRFFKKLPFAATIGIHFLSVILFVVLYVWISGFFIEQHPRAMFYMVRSILMVYPFIGAGLVIADFIVKKHNSKKTKGDAFQIK